MDYIKAVLFEARQPQCIAVGLITYGLVEAYRHHKETMEKLDQIQSKLNRL